MKCCCVECFVLGNYFYIFAAIIMHFCKVFLLLIAMVRTVLICTELTIDHGYIRMLIKSLTIVLDKFLRRLRSHNLLLEISAPYANEPLYWP